MRFPTRPVRYAAGAAAATLLAGLALTGTAAADSGSPSSTASPSGPASVLTIGVTDDIDSANPFIGYSVAAYEIFQMEYPTLTMYGPKDFSPQPRLAESWTESADHLTWTYKIRSGVTWSDGVPLTAADAAYTYNRIINGKFEQTNYASYVGNMVDAVAPDATTLVIHIKKPSPIMDHLYVYILPEHIWSKIDEKAVQSYKNEPLPGQTVVGGGAYLLAERRTGQFIRMTANPNFWGGKPKVDEIDFKIYKSQDALALALKKGEIDFADSLDANVFNSLTGVQGITQFPAEYSEFNELAFNTGAALDSGKPIGDGNPLLKDKKLRVALAYAIDRESLNQKVLGGLGQAADTIIPPLYASLHLTPASPYTYDPAKAQQMLDAAGYKVGADGVRVDSKGNRLSFRLFGRSENDQSKKAVQFIKGYLAAVGVETKVDDIGSDALAEKIGQGNYDMFEWDWVVEPDPNYQLSTFLCANRSYLDSGTVTANLSDSFYCNPAYDALFEQQSTEPDPTKRADLVKQMQQMLYDDAPYILTYYPPNLEAYRSDKFVGYVPQPDPKGSLLYQYGTWTYESVHPVGAAVGQGTPGASSTGASSTNWAMIIGIALLALIAGGVGVALGRRGGSDSDNEE
jgi:peptide/nickel transport system substrate-binding protein